jgi:hypothetical protein
MRQRAFKQEQRTTILQGILCFVLILAVLQLWLMTATMNAYLGGNDAILGPAALSSLVCVAVNVCLLRYLYALDAGQQTV